MHAQVLRPLLHTLQFQPFRIFVLEMTAYDVRIPEMAILSAHSLTLHNPDLLDRLYYEDRRIIISLAHISKVELIINSAPTTNGNSLPPPAPSRLPPGET